MPFEQFTVDTKKHRFKSPTITIRINGQIGFNVGAMRKFNINKYKFVILFFNKDTQQIGIKLSNKQEKGVSKLFIRESNIVASVKAFLDYHSIQYGKAKRYDAIWDKEGQMITVSLK